MGKTNTRCDYNLGNNHLKESKQERDLEVIINCKGKQFEQCSTAVNKANAVLGMIKRNVVFKSKDNIVRLYKALVRPKLEYCIQVWSPYLRKDIDMIERVQRRATKMIEGLSKLGYDERLRKTGSLEKRRVRGDLIQVFRMIKGFDRINYSDYFEFALENRTRGHSFKLLKKRCNGEFRKHFLRKEL